MPLSFNKVALDQINQTAEMLGIDNEMRQKAAQFLSNGMSEEDIDIYFNRKFGMPRGYGRSLLTPK